MKSILRSITIFVMVLFSLLSVIACDKDNNNDNTNDNNTEEPDNGDQNQDEITYEYTLNKTTIVLEVEGTQKLLVLVSPEKEINPTFESLDKTIATVSAEGVVTGVAAGETTIKVTVDDNELTCAVTVNPKPIVYTYSLNKEEMSLELGTSEKLSVAVNPEKTIVPTWTSDNDEVATVNSEGVVTAVGLGETLIYASVDGNELTCTVTVTSPVVITNTKTAVGDGTEVFLTDLDEELDTLYWEHYQGGSIDKMINAEDIIVSNNIESVTRAFYDYKATMGWTNGSVNTAWDRNNNGLCHDGEVVIEVKVDPSVKQIRIYSGAWRATGIATLYLENAKLGESAPWTAGDSGIARTVTFEIDVTEETIVTIKVTPSEIGEGGNISMVAVAVLGESANNPTTALTMTKTPLTDCTKQHVNLTQTGTADWAYFNYEGQFVDYKKDGTGQIKIDTLKVEGNSKGWDYPASFVWTNGTNYETNPKDPNEAHDGTNNFVYGTFVNIDVEVTAETSNVRLYATGWSSTYHVLVLDSNGTAIYQEQVQQKVEGQTRAYVLNFAVNATKTETLTFILYRTEGANTGLAAVAVSHTGDSVTEELYYEYSLNTTKMELEEESIQKLAVVVYPSKDITPVFESLNPSVATVSAEGLVTAVAPGETTIKVTVDGREFTCVVTVTKKVIVYTYEISKEETSLKVGASEKLSISVSPEKVISPYWQSDDESIATVSADGVVTAVGLGKTTIVVTVDGHSFSCEVTVTSPVSVTNTKVEDGANTTVYLTDLDTTLDTLYWEHYQGGYNFNKMINAEDLILSNNIEQTDRGFNDYKANVGWINGSRNAAWDINHNGLCHHEEITMQIKVNTNVKQIRVYTGAWRGTGTATLYIGNTLLATSDSWTAGESGIARTITFDIVATEETTIVIKITPTELGDAGNISMVAVAVLGTSTHTPTTSLTMTKQELTDCNTNVINLTEKGTTDWFYLNYEGQFVDYKKDGSGQIKRDTLKVESNGKGWDYRASFIWTNGTNYETNPTDNDGPNNGSNNFVFGTYVAIDVEVNPETGNVYLYATGWSSTYNVLVVDSNGTIIFQEKITDKIDNTNQAFELNFSVAASKTERLSFVIYKTDGVNNGLAAVAVANKA